MKYYATIYLNKYDIPPPIFFYFMIVMLNIFLEVTTDPIF